jgi:hypothetical protein
MALREKPHRQRAMYCCSGVAQPGDLGASSSGEQILRETVLNEGPIQRPKKLDLDSLGHAYDGA